MVKLVDLRWNGLSHDLSMLPTPNACACGFDSAGWAAWTKQHSWGLSKTKIKVEKVVVLYISAARILRVDFWAIQGLWVFVGFAGFRIRPAATAKIARVAP